MTILPRVRTLLAACVLWPALTLADAPEQPASHLTPREVVAAQLAALRENTPAGLARVFRFASPVNQSVTGPSARFALMLREGYPDLLGHRSAHFGELLINGEEAAQAVDIVDTTGRGHRYVFMLSRQAGGTCAGCWMTDGVVNAPGDDGVAI